MSKYKTLSEWKKDNPREYDKASNEGWLEELYKLTGWPVGRTSSFGKRTPRGYWTKKRCVKEALKYKSRTEWRTGSLSSYSGAYKNDWLDECTKHMYKNSIWTTKDSCLKEARKYKTRTEWQKSNHGSASSARNNGWYEECVEHMKTKWKPRNHWTKERCIEEAKKYEKTVRWKEVSHPSYTAARKNNWLKECKTHMIKLYKPKGYWKIKMNVLNEAKKYKSKVEWGNSSSASIQSARRNNWLKECTVHMGVLRNTKGHWTKERCVEEAKKYTSKSEWKKQSSSSYSAVIRNKWMLECEKHMK